VGQVDFALALALTALPVALSAAALSGVAWFTGRGRSSAQVLDRAADMERAVMSGVQALSGRVEAAESIIRGLAEEAAEQFKRADRARKRGQQDAARADATLAGDGQVAEEALPTDRAGMLRLVELKLRERGE